MAQMTSALEVRARRFSQPMKGMDSSGSRKFGLISKFTLLLLSSLMCVTLVELGLRIQQSRTPDVQSIDHVLDPSLRSLPVISGFGALQAPNQRAVFKGRLYRTNSSGIRGPEYRIPKPASTFRTVIIGDSFTMGSGVDEEDTYSARLEARLDADDSTRDHEVLNLGVGGFNLAFSVFRLQKRGLKYEPDLIVYGWTINDIEGLAYRKTSVPRRPALTSLVFEAWARDRYSSLRDILAPASSSYTGELHFNYFENVAAWQKFTMHLDSFAAIAQDEGVCGVVLLHTYLFALHSFHPFTRIYDAVANAAVERGLYVATSFERHRGMNPERLWIHPIDSHPNADGHQILADALYDRLVELRGECM